MKATWGSYGLVLLLSIALRLQAEEPAERLQPSLQLTKHKDWVSDVCYTRDGKQIVSVDAGGGLIVWEASSGRVFKKLFRPDVALTAIACHPKNDLMVTGQWSGAMDLRIRTSAERVVRFAGHQETVTAAAFTPDGKSLVSSSADDTTIVWDVETGDELLTLEQGNEYDVTCLDVSPDGKRIATGDGDNNVTLWDLETGERLHRIAVHEAAVADIAFSPDGKHVVSASWDRTVKVFDSKTGKETMSLDDHPAELTAVACSLDGKRIVSACEDGSCVVWNAATGKRLLEFRDSSIKRATCLAISPDSRHLAVGGQRLLLVWSLP